MGKRGNADARACAGAAVFGCGGPGGVELDGALWGVAGRFVGRVSAQTMTWNWELVAGSCHVSRALLRVG